MSLRWLKPRQHRPLSCRRNKTCSSNTAERNLGEIVEHGKNTEQQHNRMLLQKKKKTQCYINVLGYENKYGMCETTMR